MAGRDIQDINELIAKYTRERDSAVGPLRWWRGKQLARLHVAAAKALRSHEFASFDNRQRALATAIGLSNALGGEG